MNSERTYTLAQAEAELNRRQCLMTGHYWEHLLDDRGELLRVFCSNCGKGYKTVAE